MITEKMKEMVELYMKDAKMKIDFNGTYYYLLTKDIVQLTPAKNSKDSIYYITYKWMETSPELMTKYKKQYLQNHGYTMMRNRLIEQGFQEIQKNVFEKKVDSGFSVYTLRYLLFAYNMTRWLIENGNIIDEQEIWYEDMEDLL